MCITVEYQFITCKHSATRVTECLNYSSMSRLPCTMTWSLADSYNTLCANCERKQTPNLLRSRTMSEPKAAQGTDLAFAAPSKLKSAATFSFKRAGSILHFNPGKPSRKSERSDVGVGGVGVVGGVDAALEYASSNKEAKAVSEAGAHTSRGVAGGKRYVNDTKNLSHQTSWATNTDITLSGKSAAGVSNNGRGDVIPTKGLARQFSWKDKATSQRGSELPLDDRVSKHTSEQLANDYRALLDTHPCLVAEDEEPETIPQRAGMPDRSSTCTTWGQMMSQAR